MNEDKLLFLSEDWLKRYMELLNSNRQYEEVAKGWEGDFIFQVDSDGKAVTEPIRAYVDLWHGKCRAIHPAAPGETAQYIYSGTLKNWKKLLSRDIGPIKALFSRKFKIKGSMTTVMRYISAAQELVATATRVPTRFPDE
ncbi:MAG: SCP2 sterol-binding domain-containing protein [Candidatus Thorarchaeota archaeon]|nr:SCP2 sterol-binding domain-containing protein [Candidatus Thorarchaeota archaeon]